MPFPKRHFFICLLKRCHKTTFKRPYLLKFVVLLAMEQITYKFKIMPLTLTLTEGVIPSEKEKEAVIRITDAFLKNHELMGNTVMTPNVTAHVVVLPKSATYSGGQEFSGAWIEWKVPSFALTDKNILKAFFAEATDIIYQLSGGKQPKDHIYANVLHTVDGSWNMNGVAMTNEELGETISKG